MTTSKRLFVHHVTKMLLLGKKMIANRPLLTEETGNVNVKGDHSIGMDIEIEKVFINYVQRYKLPVTIFSEEAGIVNLISNPKYLLAFDPLDGSTNYKIGRGLLPFGTLIAFYKGLNPHLNNVIAAGAIEYTRNLAWITDGQETTNLLGDAVTLKTDWTINHSTPVYLDLYYREGYKRYLPLTKKIFIRNNGSTIGNLSYILSNAAAGLGSVCMRAEEIGAVYALIKGAKGIVVNHNGKDIGRENFRPERTYPFLAGNKTFIDFCLNQLNK